MNPLTLARSSSHQFNRVGGAHKLKGLTVLIACDSCLQTDKYTIPCVLPVEESNVQFTTHPDVGQRFSLSNRVAGTQKHGLSLRNHVANIAEICVSVFGLPVSCDHLLFNSHHDGEYSIVSGPRKCGGSRWNLVDILCTS